MRVFRLKIILLPIISDPSVPEHFRAVAVVLIYNCNKSFPIIESLKQMMFFFNFLYNFGKLGVVTKLEVSK